jgi:hypothetical protein
MADDPKDIDPRYAVVLIGDDGNLYKLMRKDWKQFQLAPDDPGSGVVNQLKEFGSYLTFIPTDLAVGFGFNCTVVNLKEILQNNPPPPEPPA